MRELIVLSPFFPITQQVNMVQYSLSKPPSAVTADWIFWSRLDFQRNLASDEVSSVIFVTYKKEISVIYKPTSDVSIYGSYLEALEG